MLHNDVVPFYRELDLPVGAMLTDNGREFCGTDTHPYELSLALNAIEHRRTRVRTPKTNGLVERFNGTMLDEFFRGTMRETFYRGVDSPQADLDTWLHHYNYERPHLPTAITDAGPGTRSVSSSAKKLKRTGNVRPCVRESRVSFAQTHYDQKKGLTYGRLSALLQDIGSNFEKQAAQQAPLGRRATERRGTRRDVSCLGRHPLDDRRDSGRVRRPLAPPPSAMPKSHRPGLSKARLTERNTTDAAWNRPAWAGGCATS